MKALIRNKGETILENDGINDIDWKDGYPLTGSSWAGGPYTLVQNYIPSIEGQDEAYEEIAVEPVAEENEDDYVVIDGKRYSKEELRSLLE